MLRANPSITAIFGECGNNATGAIRAIKNAGQEPGEDIKVIGFDGTKLELQAISRGEQFASVVQDFQGIGAKAVEAAMSAANDESVPKEINVPTTIITQENVGEFK